MQVSGQMSLEEKLLCNSVLWDFSNLRLLNACRKVHKQGTKNKQVLSEEESVCGPSGK